MCEKPLQGYEHVGFHAKEQASRSKIGIRSLAVRPRKPTTNGEVKAHDKASKKKHQWKPVRKQRYEAVLIKPAEGESYAEVLEIIKLKLKPEGTETCIRLILWTRNGEVVTEPLLSQL